MRHPLRAASCARLVGAAAVAALLLVGCSDPKPDPAQERRDRIERRLRSFSAAQSDCILDRLDEATLRALDRTTGTLDRAAMDDYSDAVVTCVNDPNAPTTTAANPDPTTTTRPA